jgi:hypothetical protein
LEKYWNSIQDKINWKNLCCNPNIFVNEYIFISKEYFRKYIAEDIIKKVWHFKNIDKFSYLLGDNDMFL